jgi:hypothetical protein
MNGSQARDLYSAEVKGREPRKMLRKRAIQIGIKVSIVWSPLPFRISYYY